MLYTLFSFRGTIHRMPYFVGTLCVSLFGGIAVAIVFILGATVASAVGGGNIAPFVFSAPALLAIVWISLALVLKRTRGAFGTLIPFWINVASFLLWAVPGGLWISILYSCGYSLALLFKPTIERSAVNPDLFGEQSGSTANGHKSEPFEDGSKLSKMTDEDLLARAAQLREKKREKSADTDRTARVHLRQGFGASPRAGGPKPAFGQR